MDLRTEPAGHLARALAGASLLIGLADCIRLLGVGGGPASPLETLGSSGFVILAILAVSRLFAAVGLWMQVQWGPLLLGAALAVEIALALMPGMPVTLGLFGFLFKLATLLATISLTLVAHFWAARHALE